MRLSRPLAAATAAAALLAACSGGDDSTVDVGEDAASETMEDMDMAEPEPGELGDDGDMEGMEGMDMGDTDATPAFELQDVDLVTGVFQLLDGAPASFDGAVGDAYLARGEITTATIEMLGLQPDTTYVSHVHADSCDNDGGPHFKYDPDGSDVPPNEIHLGFTTDDRGYALMTATNGTIAGDDAVSIVIHQASGDQTKALCADLA